MAKEVVVTVKVDDAQFQKFSKDFNDLADKIKGFTSRFNQIQQSVQRTTTATNALGASMRVLLGITNKLSSTVSGITTHFMKWSVLIGGIGALLGMGGGLFGIERLAASIMQKRRMMMGLGGDYGRTQASMIYNQSFLSNPANVLQNIRSGLGGNQEQLQPLLAMGIPFGTKMSPDEVLTKILEKLPSMMRNVKPGTELMWAQAVGLNKIFTDPMDLMRIFSEEGRKEMLEQQKKIEAYKKEFSLSKESQKALADLNIQLMAAKAQIESIFGEKLAKLATPLAHVSEGFVKVVRTLMNTEIVDKILNKISQWLEQFATYLEKGTVEKDIKDFLGDIKAWGGKLEEIIKVLEDFGHILKTVVDALAWVWNKLSLFRGGQALSPYTPAAPGESTFATTPRTQHPMARPGAPMGHPGPRVAPTGPGAPGTPGAAPTTPGAPGGPTIVPGGTAPRPADRFGFLGGGTNVGGNRFAALNFGGSRGAFLNQNAAFGKDGNLAFGGPGGITSNQSTSIGGAAGNRSSWSLAANRSVPRGSEGGIGSLQLAGMTGGVTRGGQRGLDIDNWQMTRTASLVVRNSPGSNMFMSAAGMA